MQTFQTVTDVLDNAQNFHRYAESLYSDLQQSIDDERGRMLLNYMAIHEHDMGSKLQLISDNASSTILGTWMQFTVEQSPQSFFKNLQKNLGESIDDIASMGQDADSYLQDVFQDARDTAPTQDIKELFDQLAAMETLEKQALSKATNSVWDV